MCTIEQSQNHDHNRFWFRCLEKLPHSLASHLNGPQEVKFAEAGDESGDCSIGSLELNAGQCLRAELITEGFVPLGGRDDPGLSDHPPGHTAA